MNRTPPLAAFPPLRPDRHNRPARRRRLSQFRPASSSWGGCWSRSFRPWALPTPGKTSTASCWRPFPRRSRRRATLPPLGRARRPRSGMGTDPAPLPCVPIWTHRRKPAAAGVKPQVIEDYAGGDIVLPGDRQPRDPRGRQPRIGIAPRPNAHYLATARPCLGPTTRPAWRSSWRRPPGSSSIPEIAHGPVRICFTCDEEIGHGVDKLDLKRSARPSATRSTATAAAKSTSRRSRPIKRW